MRRVPFLERLWRPDPCLAHQDRETADAMRAELASRVERERPSLASIALEQDEPENRPGYMAEVRRKIEGKPKPTAVPMHLTRAVGEKR